MGNLSMSFLCNFLLCCDITSYSGIRHKDIRSDSRYIIPLSQFGFVNSGHLAINVSSFSVSNKQVHSDLGFLLCTRSVWGYISMIRDCPLRSHSPYLAMNFDGVSAGAISFSAPIQVERADQYVLAFANCASDVKVSMEVDFTMYNQEPGSLTRQYLSSDQRMLPLVYSFFSLACFFLVGAWMFTLLWRNPSRLTMHWLMMTLILLKALSLLAEYKYLACFNLTGCRWNGVYYVVNLLKTANLYTLIVLLVESALAFTKPLMHERDKKTVKRFLAALIPIQVVVTTVKMVCDEIATDDGKIRSLIFEVVELIYWWAVIASVIWSMVKAARIDQTAAITAKKMILLRRYLVAAIGYIYIVRVVKPGISDYRINTTGVVVEEVATIVFCMFTGYVFKPEEESGDLKSTV